MSKEGGGKEEMSFERVCREITVSLAALFPAKSCNSTILASLVGRLLCYIVNDWRLEAVGRS